MILFLSILQLSFLVLQLFCLLRCVVKDYNPVEYLYGYAIWGVIPNVLTGCIIRELS